MKRLTAAAAISLAMLSLNAHADTYMLGTVQYTNKKPQPEQRKDTAFCGEEARNAAGSAGAQTAMIAGGVLGGAIGGAIGGLIGDGLEKDHRRELFTACMTEKGYVVFPAGNEDRFSRIKLPNGFKKIKLSDTFRSLGWELGAEDTTAHAFLLAMAIDKKYIPDLRAYAQDKSTGLTTNPADQNRLVTEFQFNNYKGYTFTSAGFSQVKKQLHNSFYLSVNNLILVIKLSQPADMSPEDAAVLQNGVIQSLIDALQPEPK